MLQNLGANTRCALNWAPGDESADLLIALHARRSSDSVLAWRQTWPHKPVVVVLTGTDLYRDIRTDASAQASLDITNKLVVLQDAGLDELRPEWRAKTDVVYQSTPKLAHVPRLDASAPLDVLMVGHLRDEKDPATYMRAATRLTRRTDLTFAHAGGGLDAQLHQMALDTQAACRNYVFLGALTHDETLARIARADLLVHASVMEGGAHVILEAVQSDTPVLASRISGNIGMLGGDYSGYFELGDDLALASLVERCRDDTGFLNHLRSQCAARSHLFEPLAEQQALARLIAGL